MGTQKNISYGLVQFWFDSFLAILWDCACAEVQLVQFFMLLSAIVEKKLLGCTTTVTVDGKFLNGCGLGSVSIQFYRATSKLPYILKAFLCPNLFFVEFILIS